MPNEELDKTMTKAPIGADAVLALADGTCFWGRGIGARGLKVGELCFHTAMTGYQEILTDPSYAGQILVFSYPHIGNVGINRDDDEARAPLLAGCVLRCRPTPPSSYRSDLAFDAWLETRGLTAIWGIDTRALVRRIRDRGAVAASIFWPEIGPESQPLDATEAHAAAQAFPGLVGQDLAASASVATPSTYKEPLHELSLAMQPLSQQTKQRQKALRVSVLDLGAKDQMLKILTAGGCEVRRFPATAQAQDLLSIKPDGIFLTNGPGDPTATYRTIAPTLAALLDSGVPIYGICLGHQLLALALGGATRKMDSGHHGANHPVQDLRSGRVMITSQNHEFVVDEARSQHLDITHRSLFDGTIAGISSDNGRVAGVQFHPEASPGPHDTSAWFGDFLRSMA